MDFVETPSHLIEYYVWNREFLDIIGKHYITGEPIPTKNLENLKKITNLLERHCQEYHQQESRWWERLKRFVLWIITECIFFVSSGCRWFTLKKFRIGGLLVWVLVYMKSYADLVLLWSWILFLQNQEFFFSSNWKEICVVEYKSSFTIFWELLNFCAKNLVQLRKQISR